MPKLITPLIITKRSYALRRIASKTRTNRILRITLALRLTLTLVLILTLARRLILRLALRLVLRLVLRLALRLALRRTLRLIGVLRLRP